jgi:hypothetical protein
MATLNLDNDNVFVTELTLEQARNIDESVTEMIDTAIDEAQAHVHMERGPISYVVIVIKA